VKKKGRGGKSSHNLLGFSKKKKAGGMERGVGVCLDLFKEERRSLSRRVTKKKKYLTTERK